MSWAKIGGGKDAIGGASKHVQSGMVAQGPLTAVERGNRNCCMNFGIGGGIISSKVIY